MKADSAAKPDPFEQRMRLYEQTPWDHLRQLVIGAGLGRYSGWRPAGKVRRASGAAGGGATGGGLSGVAAEIGRKWEVVPERVVALSVLVVISGLLKVTALMPSVLPEHEAFRGFQANELINDPRAALAYILERFPSCFPSYQQLLPQSQHAIRFVHARTELNPGWLVQAEAPPAALFSRFKHALLREGGMGADISLYFVHWIAELGATRARPLRGSETFVFRFPQHVLERFIFSFQYVGDLATQTETRVNERYLEARWEQDCSPFGLGREGGAGGVALMRLSVHMQQNAERLALVRAFRRAPADVVAMLAREMSLTGLAEQVYAGCDAAEPQRPAIVVMYAPQFLRNMARRDDALEGLCILAEVYRVMRTLWPRDGGGPPDGTVTARIEQLRDMTTEQIMGVYTGNLLYGQGWFMSRRGQSESMVERLSLNEKRAEGAMLLAFWRLKNLGGEAAAALGPLPPPPSSLEESAVDKLGDKKRFRFDITSLQPDAVHWAQTAKAIPAVLDSYYFDSNSGRSHARI